MIGLLPVCIFGNLRAQSPVQVSEPSLSLKDGKVQITYDLLNTSRTDQFTIRIEVSLSGGQAIDAASLSGDIGKGVQGGLNKKILWDIEKDQVFLDEEIFVEVFAHHENPPMAVEEQPVEEQPVEEQPVEEQPVKEQLAEEQLAEEQNTDERAVNSGDDANVESPPVTSMETGSGKEFSRTSLIIQSIAFPGLGLSRKTGSPHWLRGVAAYGCLGSAVFLNRSAWNTYQDYLEVDDPGQVDALIDKAYTQQKTARYLGYAAVGIWVADLAWTLAGSSDMNRGMQLGAAIDPLSGAPMMALRLKF